MVCECGSMEMAKLIAAALNYYVERYGPVAMELGLV
jgi:hypothetical protein